MRNWTRSSGVYSSMLRVLLFLVCSLALAQPSPQQDPLDQAIQAVWQARNSGRFEESAASRDRARALFQQKSVDAPQFAGWAQQVAQIYQNSSLNAQARTILQDALGATAPLGDSHPGHISMLIALGNAWQQDGNLLKAVGYLEQAAAAQAAAPPAPPPSAPRPSRLIAGDFTTAPPVGAAQAVMGMKAFGSRTAWFTNGGGAYYPGSVIDTYIRLAGLYRQLGRPDAVAAIAVKIRTLAANNPATLARFYEQHGPLEQAAAIYRKLADQQADPQAKANALQSLANLDARQEHFTDAIAATRQAIAAIQTSDKPEIRDQALWMRQNLVNYMRQAGMTDQVDQTYRQMLLEGQGRAQESQMLAMYAQYLAGTQRAALGESLLKDYLAAHPNLDQPQKTNVLFQLANVVRGTGDSERADEYYRAAQALQPQPPPPPPGQVRIGEGMQKAQTAINQRRWDDAYSLVLQLIDGAAHAADGQQVPWMVPQFADALAANKEPAKAELIYQRVLALGRNWSVDNVQPLITVTQSYARFLMNQPDRLGDVPAAIEQYRGVLADANGPDSASLGVPLQMKIEFQRAHSQPEAAEASARQFLALEESLSGNTSEPYLGALQTLAQIHEAAGNSAQALPLLRKRVTIADLIATPDNGWLRSSTRMDTALALARMGQFEEAETLGEQAVALQQNPRTPGPPLAEELQQIRTMKKAAAASPHR